MPQPLGLAWLKQINAGVTPEAIAAHWPSVTPQDVASAIKAVRERFPQAANHST